MNDHQSPQALRAEALESLLVEKGLLQSADVDAVIQRYTERIGPMNGARVVAHAWLNQDYRRQLLADGSAAVKAFDFEGGQMERLVVKANSAKEHHVVVCTLCSCYPWALLGLPPAWYKDPEYRSRIVREPRRLLQEMGLELNPEVTVQVWDSSAEVRYLVLPERPAGTQGWDEAALTGLVNRDSMIGVALATSPEDAVPVST